ncbi:hypothetical protein ABZZ36_37755 [Actinacidiphila glaucinigra]|uniref:hypothetical protein n=1 Tax=Actinacidiphila glaucinigra TaxID=235986 RepID=UPI0033B17FFE
MGKKRDRETAESAAKAPGAGTGEEDQAHERVVRGSASGAEGYSAEHGTLAGNPIEGLETNRPEKRDGES